MNAVLAMSLMRLHRTLGLVFGPFLLVAALSGAIYALTPQLEEWLYRDLLTATDEGSAQPLSAQIKAAQAALSVEAPLAAVRPAPRLGHSTRVMFKAPDSGASEHWAVFVDPVSLAIQGQLPVYGTSGVLPLRTAIDLFHRELLIGPWGRWYSELAASWLWLLALGGACAWWLRPKTHAPRSALRRWHSRVGLVLLLGLLFFSATGLTWSQYAGSNISLLRATLGMSTPSLKTGLDKAAPQPFDEHHEHNHHSTQQTAAHLPQASEFEHMLHVARAAGLDADKLEIVASHSLERAWTVNEIDRSWPTQVDAVAINASNYQVVDQVRFADYPLAAKLTRWGIDAHMGVLFGTANQLLLVIVALGLAGLVIWGYVLVLAKRSARAPSLWQLVRTLPKSTQATAALVCFLLALALPVLGVSLLIVMVFEALTARGRTMSAP